MHEIKLFRKRVVKDRDELFAMIELMRALLDAVQAHGSSVS